jgi:hypothetical protein
VDLSRGRERFLTVTVEITGTDPGRLRRVQPLRDDFQVLAGKESLPCRWLRGGSLPEDPRRLRFVLGFSMPPARTRTIALRANLPRLEGEDALELRLTGLQLTSNRQERTGPGWRVDIFHFGEVSYEPPALPAKGQFTSKLGPADVRVFRKEEGKDVPERAIMLHFRSNNVELYDPTLDVSGSLTTDGAVTSPLIAASMVREPSRAVKNPVAGPFASGTFWFQVPSKGRGPSHRRRDPPPPPPTQPQGSARRDSEPPGSRRVAPAPGARSLR